MNRETFQTIIAAAIQAPSGDNVQPWEFKATEDLSALDIFNLPDRDDSYYNYHQAAAYITHGAVIENISIASQHLGYTSTTQIFPDPNNPNHIATIFFQAAEKKPNPLYSAIFTRCTNRFNYRSEQLSEDSHKKLLDAVSNIEGTRTYLTNNRDLIKRLASVLKSNDRLVFEREDIHRFLFDKIRWNSKQVEATQDGMSIDTLGLSSVEKPFFPLMRFWQFVKLANHIGLSQIIGFKCWYNCYSAAALGQITVKNYDSPGFIQAGRAMQRVWLEAERQGLAFQPIIGLPLLMYRAKNHALQAFTEKQRSTVITAENHLRDLLDIDSEDLLAVGFRIGKGPKVPVKTLRKPINLS